MLGKRLINSNSAAAGGSCTTDTLQILGDTSCIAYYKMSDATDESGSYDGTPSNVNFNVQGKFGNAGSFNGSSSVIDISASAGFPSSVYTVSMWLKINDVTAYKGFFLNVSSSNLTNQIGVVLNSGRIDIYSVVSNNNNTLDKIETTPQTAFVNNTWYNVVIIADRSLTNKVQVFVNNTENTYNYAPNSSGTTGYSTAKIGFADGNYFSGSIDNVRIFNKSLSSSEVTTLYDEVYCVPTIVPTANFNTVLYNGTGTTNARTDVGFKPDLVWIKSRGRGNPFTHRLTDSVRGVQKQISSDTTDIEATENGVMSFDTAGFTLGDAAGFNIAASPNTFVAWNWKAGGAAIQNNDGSITGANCLVSANQDAGFSITKYTGNGTSGATFGHGLGQQVGLSIVKNVGSSTYWYVYSNLLPTNNNLYLNTADSKQADGVMLGGNSTTVSISASSSVNTNSGSYIAYNFASVDGMSRVGSYVGGGTTDVPITLGFRPAFVMIKSSTYSPSGWIMYDNKRQTGTGAYENYSVLFADTSQVEATDNVVRGIQFNSNGFIANQNYEHTNDSGDTYIFLAIAEEVFNPSGVTRNATNPFGDASEKALYKFEDNANDAEGSYNGTESNVTYASGYIDKAAVFNGSSSYISTSNPLGTGNVAYSISAWIYLNASSHTGGIYAIWDGGASVGTYLFFKLDAGKISIGNYGASVTSANTLVVNQWVYVAVTRDTSNNVVLYVNGSSDTTGTLTLNLSNNNPKIGALNTTTQNFNGKLDQVRVFDRALDSGEITQLYNE